jgi:2-desacetyl-2-hydroxyethyl bacteriochlorophyllide A dehydrogenase
VTPQRIVFPQTGAVELETFELEPVNAGEVAVRIEYTLMSTGTELTIFNGRFDPGTHWAQYATYPFQPGYAGVGEVVETGPEVDDLSVGDRVVVRARHASHHVAPAFRCARAHEAIDRSLAPWFALAKIAFTGALAAEYRLGDTVLIVGAGPIGQMAVRWASAAGARAIVVIDPVEARLALARRGGATSTIALPVGDAGDQMRAALGADGPDVVIDSTGNAEVLTAVLGLVRARGRVVILGDTGMPANQHLTSDVIVRGITIVGAHDGLTVGPNWDGDRAIFELFFHLAATDRFDLEGLNTHTFHPRDCAAAYELANERRADTMGIVFDWRQL